MRKRVVILETKEDKPQIKVYYTVLALFKENDVGVCVGTLWNALHKGKGFYENKRCKIYYRKVEDSR